MWRFFISYNGRITVKLLQLSDYKRRKKTTVLISFIEAHDPVLSASIKKSHFNTEKWYVPEVYDEINFRQFIGVEWLVKHTDFNL